MGKFGSTTTSTTTTTSTETIASTETTPLESLQQAATDVITEVKTFFGIKTHPGQGLEHRSDRANEVARNTEKNKHLNGGIPGGEHGKDNNNKGGNGNNGNNGNQGNNGNDKTNPDNGNTGNDGSTGGGSKATYDYGGTFLYYYHPDHLGSTGYVTDENAELYEHVEYFPFGETWLQEAANTLQRVPYRYTGKELDEETGLYYYGARYYDPRTSVWQSVDPILGEYLPDIALMYEAKKEGEAYLPEKDLRGQGGVYNSMNLGLYTYVHNKPVITIDPNGEDTYGIEISITGGFAGGGTSAFSFVWDDKGNWDALSTKGAGANLNASAGAAVVYQETNAPDVSYLKGLSLQSEVSVGEGPQLVGGMFGGGNESTEYTGEYFGGGVGGGLLPATVTLMITNSESKKSEIQPIVDAFKQVGKDVSDTYNDAIDYVSDLF